MDEYIDKKSGNKWDASESASRSARTRNWIWARNKRWTAAWPMATQWNWINKSNGYNNDTGKEVWVDDYDGDGNKNTQFSLYRVDSSHSTARQAMYQSWSKSCWTANQTGANVSSGGYTVNGGLNKFRYSTFTGTLRSRLWGNVSNNSNWNSPSNSTYWVENHPWLLWGHYAEMDQERTSKWHNNSDQIRDYCRFGVDPMVGNVFPNADQQASDGIVWQSDYEWGAWISSCFDCHSGAEIYANEMSQGYRPKFRAWSPDANTRWSRNAENDGSGHDTKTSRVEY
jgi:hypothetical protein